MANMSVDSTKKNFLLPIEISANGTVTKTLNTTDTYIDKDIKIEITTPDATYTKGTQSVTAVASTNDTTYTTTTDTGYAITLLADASSTDVKVEVDQAGFAAASDEVTVEGVSAAQASKTVYIKAGELEGTGEVTLTGKGGVDLGTKQATAPSSGFYIEADASGSVGVKTAGWVDPDNNTAVSTASTAYYPVASVTLNNEAASGKTYTTVNTPILKSGSGLFINEGYIENTYISLADLVPDDATLGKTPEQGNDKIYKTVSVYDKDGTLVTGTMDDVTADNIVVTDNANTNATISSVTITEGTDANKFVVSGTGATEGTVDVNINKTGYIVSDTKVENVTVSGEATVDATLNVIVINATADNSNVTVTPVIAKETSTAASSTISKTAPADQHYVAVSTAAIAASSTVTPGVTAEGYGTSAKHTATGTTVTAGAAESGTYYVGITNGSVVLDGTISGTDVTGMTNNMSVAKTTNVASMAGVLDTAPASGEYITISAATSKQDITVSGSVGSDITEGYVTEANESSKQVSTTVSVNATSAAKYIKVYDGSYI